MEETNKELIKKLKCIQQDIYDIFNELHSRGFGCLINIHLPAGDDHYEDDDLVVDRVTTEDLTEEGEG